MPVFTRQDHYGQYSKSMENAGRTPASFDDWWNNTQHNGYYDDDYLAEIEKYKNEPWYNNLLTNPWLAGNQASFTPNLGQSIMSALFNDDSAERKYYAELQSNRSQWLSEFVEKMRQQEYNSAPNQAQLTKEAGINPALAGNADSPASENDQPLFGHPSFGAPLGLPEIGSFFMNIYTLASGFAKDALGLQSMLSDIQSKDVSRTEQLVGFATKFIQNHTALGQTDLEDGSTEYTVIPPTEDMIRDFAGKYFRSNRVKNRFVKEVKSQLVSGSGRSAQYGSVATGQRAKGELAQVIGHNEAFGGNELDPMVIVEKNLSRMVRDIEEAQRKYTSDYFHEASGTLAGQAVNEENQGIVDENKARSYQRKMDSIINKTMETIISSLEKSVNLGGIEGLIAKGMLGLISAYRLQMLPNLPSVNLSGLIQNRNFNTYETTKNIMY